LKRLFNVLAALCICIMTTTLLHPMVSNAENRVISGIVEAYSSRSQNCTIRLSTENNWRAECNYSFIHLKNTTGSYGDSDLNFTLDENTSSSSRMGWITIYDTKLYSPIFSFEINQAGAGSAPPAVGPYFTNEVAALDDGYEAVSWNTSSFNFKFMSNRNLTMKVDGKTVSPSKTSINNGYVYQYSLYMGYNYTLKSRSYVVDVTVDGTNVSGGNSHRYYISQARTPIILDNAKITEGRISSSDGGYQNKALKVNFRTNDDIEVWFTWRSKHALGSYSTKTGDKTTYNLNLNSTEVVNGRNVIFTANPTFSSGFLGRSRKDLKLHIRSINTGKELVIDVKMDYDYNPSSGGGTGGGSGTGGGTGGGGQTEPEKPKDEKISYDISMLSLGTNSFIKDIDGIKSSYTIRASIPSCTIYFNNINTDWVILETYTDSGTGENAIKRINVAASGTNNSSSYFNVYLQCKDRQLAELYDFGRPLSTYVREYYIITKAAYEEHKYEIDNFCSYDSLLPFQFFKAGTYKKLFKVTFSDY